MSHTLIIGITDSGKTTLAQRLAFVYKSKSVPVLVLDPFKSDNWHADYITDNPEEFLTIISQLRNCAIFIDEAGDMIGRWGGVMNQTATKSRHYGHNAHFIVQRAKMLDISVRTMCVNIFCFKSSLYDTKELANEFVADNLTLAHTLKKGQFLCKIGIDGAVKQSKIF